MATEPNRLPQQPGQQQGAGTPSPMRQELSKGLAETAFGFFASAAAEAVDDPTVAEPIRAMGSRIAQTMQQRWWQKEFENFNAQHGQEYQQKSMTLLEKVKTDFNNINNGFYTDDAGNSIEVDPVGEQANRLRDNLLRDATMQFTRFGNDYMNAAAKYAANPFVNQAVMNMMQQTTGTIQGVTGPSQSQLAEQQYAETNLAREEAELKKRLPQKPSGNGSKKEDLDPLTLWHKVGGNPNRYMGALMTKHRDWLEPYWAQAAASTEAAILDQNHDWINQPDRLQRAVEENSARTLQLAAGKFVEVMLPGAGSIVRSMPGGEQYFPQQGFTPDQPQRMTADLPKQEREKFATEMIQTAGQYLDEVIRTHKPKTYENAIDMVMADLVNPMLRNKIDPRTKGGQSLQKRIRSRIIGALSDKEYMGRFVPSVREEYNVQVPKTKLLGREKPYTRLLDR